MYGFGRSLWSAIGLPGAQVVKNRSYRETENPADSKLNPRSVIATPAKLSSRNSFNFHILRRMMDRSNTLKFDWIKPTPGDTRWGRVSPDVRYTYIHTYIHTYIYIYIQNTCRNFPSIHKRYNIGISLTVRLFCTSRSSPFADRRRSFLPRRRDERLFGVKCPGQYPGRELSFTR